jgi:FdhD protein
MNFAAALLAGGRSTRMGQDKAWLLWQGEPLAKRQLRVLAETGAEVLMVSAREDQEFDELGDSLMDGAHLMVFDPPGTDEGPLGGIVHCLQTTDLPLLALAVDMPHMTADFLRDRLLSHFDDGQGIVFRGAHGFEPLAAIYSPAMLPLLEQALQEGRLGLQALIQEAAQQGLIKVLDMQPADEPFFRNVNTPDDIAEDKFAAPVQMLRLHRDGKAESFADLTAREEPLEIRVQGRNVAVVMRTPGHDRELAAGFLLSEGVVQRSDQILDIIKCPGTGRSKGNIVDVLVGDAEVDWDSLTRHTFSASSCGLCGKTSIDSVFQRFAPVVSDVKASPKLLWSLADKVRAAQATFTKTGGLHACAIFDLEGKLIVLREDVGRHNALDKILGYALLHDLLPFDRHVLFLSGRVSFEMMQKALAAGVPILAAISAPSSLAVQFAEESNQTLVGFLREKSLNVYTHGHRVAPMTNDN